MLLKIALETVHVSNCPVDRSVTYAGALAFCVLSLDGGWAVCSAPVLAVVGFELGSVCCAALTSSVSLHLLAPLGLCT